MKLLLAGVLVVFGVLWGHGTLQRWFGGGPKADPRVVVDRRQDPTESTEDIDDCHRPRRRDVDFGESRADLNQLPERWVIPYLIVLLDWSAEENHREVQEIRTLCIEMNRHLYDVTDGQVRVAKFYIVDRDAGWELTTPGIFTIHRDWERAQRHQTRGYERNMSGFSTGLGTAQNPTFIHLGYDLYQESGLRFYAGTMVHEFMHAFVGLDDEYYPDIAMRGRVAASCPEDPAVKQARESCVMDDSYLTELCRPDDHSKRTAQEKTWKKDCYSKFVESVNRHVTDRTGDVEMPASVMPGPTRAPEPAFEYRMRRETTPPPTSTSIAGAFKRVWMEHSVTVDGELGMKVHANFTARGMKGRRGNLSLYFSDAQGTPLKDTDRAYATFDGNVAAGQGFEPRYDDAVYDDLWVFMPYDQFHLGAGHHDLRATLVMWDAGEAPWRVLAQNDPVTFWYELDAPKRTASIDDIRVDHNIADANGDVGMLIHARVTVTGLKGGQGYLTATFAFADGTALKDFDGYYATASGDVATGGPFTPEYEEAEFPDFQIYVPYSQLHLRQGYKHALDFTLKVLAETGGAWTELAVSPKRAFQVDYSAGK